MKFETSEQHVDLREANRLRDNTDVSKLTEWFTLHHPLPQGHELMSISTGVIGNDTINCDAAVAIGTASMNKLVGKTFGEVTLHRKDRVLPLAAVNSSVKIQQETVPINTVQLFSRIIYGKRQCRSTPCNSSAGSYAARDSADQHHATLQQDHMRQETVPINTMQLFSRIIYGKRQCRSTPCNTSAGSYAARDSADQHHATLQQDHIRQETVPINTMQLFSRIIYGKRQCRSTPCNSSAGSYTARDSADQHHATLQQDHIRQETVPINTMQLFSRIICVSESDEDFASYLELELAPRPLSSRRCQVIVTTNSRIMRVSLPNWCTA